MNISISKTPSCNLRELFWNIFFKSKNRGVSLDRHFPWLKGDSGDTFFFEVLISSVTVAGLVLRQRKYKIDEREVTIGMVGLVCVASEYRGAGIATELLTKTINYSNDNNYDYLTLWTNKHDVYSKHNFYVADPWQYGGVATDGCFSELGLNRLFIEKSVFELDSLPLPPFASAVHEYSFGDLSFTLIKGSEGDIVVDYKGSAFDLGLFMIQELPVYWRLNVIKKDPLISVLVNFGADVKLVDVNIQMWLDLKNIDQQNSTIKRIIIPVLDRI